MEIENNQRVWDKFINKEMIGSGSNGNRVYRVTNKFDYKIYAMKKIIIKKDDQDKYLNEINIFKNLNHPNIIKYYESFIHKGKLFIIMEYAEKGDLNSLIKNKILKNYEYIQEEEIWKWIIQIAAAVKYIHSKKIIHRDIKVENVFITSEGNLKLGDFGISKILEDTFDFAKSGVGTTYYLSPEICQGLKYNFKSDIWMIGCLIYELCTLKKPFRSESINSLIKYIIYNDPEPINNKKYSKDLLNLIYLMLKKNPEERPNIIDIWNSIQIRSNSNHQLQNIFNPKIIDKSKLKIEVEDQESLDENSQCVSNKFTPVSSNNHRRDNSISTRKYVDYEKIKKHTPSYGGKAINKIMKHLKISPMNTPTTLVKLENYKNNAKASKSRRQISQTNISPTQKFSGPSASKSQINSSYNLYKATNRTGNTEKNFKNKHCRHISINISSLQSPEHKAVYQIDNIEEIVNVKYQSPLSSDQSQPSMNLSKPSFTPTRLNISPNKILSKREIPNTTKMTKIVPKRNPIGDSLIRKALLKDFLIERYSKKKFDIIYDDIVHKNKIEEKKIRALVGEDYKIAISYFRYLLSNKK